MFALVPEETAHTLGNHTPAPALDGAFAELAALWHRPRPPTLDEEQAPLRRHGTRPA